MRSRRQEKTRSSSGMHLRQYSACRVRASVGMMHSLCAQHERHGALLGVKRVCWLTLKPAVWSADLQDMNATHTGVRGASQF